MGHKTKGGALASLSLAALLMGAGLLCQQGTANAAESRLAQPATQQSARSAALVDRGLEAALDGNYDDAEDSISEAFSTNPADPRAAEALLALRMKRSDRDGAVEAAAALLSHGNDRQALAAAATLDSLGEGARAVVGMKERRSMYSDIKAVEWLAAKAAAGGVWREARDIAMVGYAGHPDSWRCLLLLATANAMLDRPEAALGFLSEARQAGAPREASNAAARAVEAARTRASMDADAKRAEAAKAAESPVEARDHGSSARTEAAPMPAARRIQKDDSAMPAAKTRGTQTAAPLPKADPDLLFGPSDRF